MSFLSKGGGGGGDGEDYRDSRLLDPSSALLNKPGGGGNRLDLRSLLGVRGSGGGRGGSVSAPSTPVDDFSSLYLSSTTGGGGTTGGNKSNGSNKKRPSASGPGMAESILKELLLSGHPAHAEALKAHSALTIKLLKTVSDFTHQLSSIEEQHSVQLQQLVETFRKRNAELRKERPNGSYGLFQVWDTLLQEVEVDSAVVSDVANCLSRQVSRPLVDGTFHRKLEARKIFQHREALEQALDKASQQLDKSYQLYYEAYQEHLFSPNTLTLAAYVQLHNNYVQDVRAANAMADQYQGVILPQLIQELENVYVDLSRTMTATIQHGCDAMSERSEGMSKRYSALAAQCRSVNPAADLTTFVRSVLASSSGGTQQQPSINNKLAFRNPAAMEAGQSDGSIIQDASLILKDELVFDRLAGFSLRSKYESLKKDVGDVEGHVRQLAECLDSLNRMQQRSLEANLYNKANELQEEICAKKLDWRLAQLRLAALRAQRDLYGSKAEALEPGSNGPSFGQQHRGSRISLTGSSGPSSSGGGNGSNGGSGGGGGGMKSKWMKAIRTLTNSGGGGNSFNGTSSGLSATACISGHSPSGTSLMDGGTTTTTNRPSSPGSIALALAGGGSRDSEKGSRLYQAVMAVIAIRKSPVPPPSAPSSGGGGKLQPHQRHLHQAVSSSDLLAYQQQQQGSSSVPPFVEGGPNGQKHIFQENTYKKITPCDVCSQVLRGHSRQGWKCRLCKMNVHADCRNSVGRCMPKSRLLRRQKSGSELLTNSSSSADVMNSAGMMMQTNSSQQLDREDELGMPFDPSSSSSAPQQDSAPDPTYAVLKQAGELASSTSTSSAGMSSNRRRCPPPPLDAIPADQQQQQQQYPMVEPSGGGAVSRPSRPNMGLGGARRGNPNTLSVGEPTAFYPSSSAPHSPRRGQKLNLRMKSFSLDESGEHFHQSGGGMMGGAGARSGSGGTTGVGGMGGGVGGGSGGLRHHSHHHLQPGGQVGRHMRSGSNPSCNSISQGSSYSQSPSSPVQPIQLQNRRLLSVRMNSVELPDDNEKSQSSASASPCPSPKTQRLLPTNLYVVLFNFKGREADELDLKAGYKVTVIDASDPDWWRGKCLGRTGYFPSKYVTKLAPNERPLQVTHNLQLSDGDADDGGLHKLLRDQIVIQVGEEENGMVSIRSGDNKLGTCPSKFLQEV